MPVFDIFRRNSESRTSTLAQPSASLLDALTDSSSTGYSGVTVSTSNALRLSSAYAAVRLLSEVRAMLPTSVMRYTDAGSATDDTHPLHFCLHNEPNGEQDAFQLAENIIWQQVLWGNFYAEKVWDASGRVKELWPLQAAYMSVKREGGALVYDYVSPTVQIRDIPAERIFHLPIGSSNGIVGDAIISWAKESIATGMSVDKFAARYFNNGMNLGGFLKTAGVLDEEAYERLLKQIATKSGADKAHSTLILEEGLEWQARDAFNPEMSQMLDSRKFTVTDVARVFRIPPHMIGDLERATFSNISDQDIAFWKYTMMPHLKRFEAAANRQLLSGSQKRTHFVKVNADALLRGDVEKRWTAYQIGLQNGVITRNEVREKEDMNTLPGLDEPSAPMYGEVEENAAPQKREARGVERRARLADSYRSVIRDAAERIVKREVADLRRKGLKVLADSPESFRDWVKSQYADVTWMRDVYEPALATYAALAADAAAGEVERAAPEYDIDAYLQAYLDNLVKAHAGRSRGALEDASLEDEPEAAVESVAIAWEESRADSITNREAVELREGVAVSVFAALGVSTLVSRTTGSSNCPYCRALDGRVVSTGSPFLEDGQEFNPEGAPSPMKVRGTKTHPPYHKGCDCVVVPGQE